MVFFLDVRLQQQLADLKAQLREKEDGLEEVFAQLGRVKWRDQELSHENDSSPGGRGDKTSIDQGKELWVFFLPFLPRARAQLAGPFTPPQPTPFPPSPPLLPGAI